MLPTIIGGSGDAICGQQSPEFAKVTEFVQGSGLKKCDQLANIGLTMKNTEPKDAITGIVTASNWDENDRITAVTLSATDDEEYLIENGDKFIELVQHFIKATGVIKRQKKSPKSIYIQKYKILEDHSVGF